MVSTFKKTVSLDDWWLIKSEEDFNGRKLAVAGIKSETGYMATRIFSSAPIVKAYGMFNVITADGIPVFLNDYINKTRTCENGFSIEVCNCFAVGFPTYWEDFSYNCGQGFTPRTTSRHSKKHTNTKDPSKERSVKTCKTSDNTDKSNEKLKYLSNRLTALCGSGAKTFATTTPDKTPNTENPSSAKSTSLSQGRRLSRVKNVEGDDTMIVVSEDFDHEYRDIIKRSTRLDEEKQRKRKTDDEIGLPEKPTRVLRSRSRLQC